MKIEIKWDMQDSIETFWPNDDQPKIVSTIKSCESLEKSENCEHSIFETQLKE